MHSNAGSAALSTGVAEDLARGAIASLLSYLAAAKWKQAFNDNDSLDVFGVHGVDSIAGALLMSVFIHEGAGEGGFTQFIVQGKSLLVTVVWSALAYIIAVVVAKLLCGEIRLEEKVEHGGLDRYEHGIEAYNWEA